MPLYEFFCKHCDGVFETMRPITKASEPAPCPVCRRQAGRIPPTSFAAFTMREGYPRAIPDRGTYWHLEQEVKQPLRGSFRPNEHPELVKREPKRRPSKGEVAIARDKAQAQAKEAKKMRDSGAPIIHDSTGAS
ncbi:MAG: zinc ribbon domain-containing protein [Dehalococcoidia bacterium]|nr:zinc ribbon domain-containing protein [Dehalococcoidia bacterium]